LKTEGPQTGPESRENGRDDNVVRLPRDWIGPREDLIPFGPRATGSRPASGPATSPPVPNGAPAPTAASDFWDGSAEHQDPLHGPIPDVAASGGAPRRAPVRLPGLPARVGPPGAIWRGRLAVLAALLTVAAVMVAAVRLASAGDGHGRTARVAAALVPVRTLTHSLHVWRVIRVESPAHRPHPVVVSRHPARAARVPLAPAPDAGVTSASASAAAGPSSSGRVSYNPPAPVASDSSPASSAAAGSVSGSPSSSSASTGGQPAGPTGPAAILGPGHCSC
jgi:hypothetical protein